jgi:hypothetical protein
LGLRTSNYAHPPVLSWPSGHSIPVPVVGNDTHKNTTASVINRISKPSLKDCSLARNS